jgi:Family of unknown function (DUF6334)
MPEPDVLDRVHETRARLRGVVAHADSANSWHPDPDAISIPLDAANPWRLALGKPLFWSWSMTDQSGYRDGLQLEFAD